MVAGLAGPADAGVAAFAFDSMSVGVAGFAVAAAVGYLTDSGLIGQSGLKELESG